MRIKRQESKGLRPFGELLPGAVFEYDNVVYLRVELDIAALGGKHLYNAICVTTGLGAHITDDLRVQPLDAELVIR